MIPNLSLRIKKKVKKKTIKKELEKVIFLPYVKGGESIAPLATNVE
jgi:hypothetical protein